MGWSRTNTSNISPIIARFWHIMDGIEIKKKKKKNNYANLLNCIC